MPGPAGGPAEADLPVGGGGRKGRGAGPLLPPSPLPTSTPLPPHPPHLLHSARLPLKHTE